MDQTFNGPVGQVAGRDIVNVGNQDLRDFGAHELLAERKRCRIKLWGARLKLLGYAGIAVAMMLGIAALYLGNIGREMSATSYFGGMAVMTILSFMVIWIRQRFGALIALYATRLHVISMILYDSK
ncbi:MAG: hypothetical protein ACOY5C_04870 [Pseudomonadota bacterium]